jgi:3-phenylpropionate/cinnamic acid dioxygenase small subunit
VSLEVEAVDARRYSFYLDEAFYAELVDGLQDWYHDGTLADPKTRADCEAFLFREARLLDDGRFDAWLDLFTPQCLYWIPSVVGGGDPRRQVSLVFDDRRRLEDRVFWLQCGFAYSQTPRSRTSHMLGNIEVFQDSTEDQVRIRSSFVVHEFRQGKGRSLAGWYGHRLQKHQGEWKIVQKLVNLIDSDQGQDNLTFLL